MIEYNLTEKEKGIILGIILNTRNDYLKKNKYSKIQYVNLESVAVITATNKVEDDVERIVDNLVSSSELENLFSNNKIKKIIKKALTKKDKSVLFLYYCKNKTDKETAKILNLKEDTARKIRNRAIDKIRKMMEE